MEEVIKVNDCAKNISDYDIKTHNAIIIPPKATNGDVMKEIFPNITMEGIGGDGCISCIAINIGMGTSYFALDWWNAPYDSESEAKINDNEPVIAKIRTELIQSIQNGTLKIESGNEELFRILDKYKEESGVVK